MPLTHVETGSFAVYYIAPHLGMVLLKLNEWIRCWKYCWTGACIIFGGDLNVCIGCGSGSSDVDLLGSFRFADRNGIYNANGRKPTNQIEDSWSFRRSTDVIFIQINFIILDRPTVSDSTYTDNVIPIIGGDHRCVHSTFHVNTPAFHVNPLFTGGKQEYNQ